MPQVLMVQDSDRLGAMLRDRIMERLHFDVSWAHTYNDAVQLIDSKHQEFLVGLLDVELPDEPGSSIVDYALSKNIPAIVFTKDLNDELRERIWTKTVVDYVPKDGSDNVDYVVSLIRRIHRNRSIKVLVVDDSSATRSYLRRLMQVHLYQVIEAGDGIEARQALRSYPDIRLVITDFNMPNMDGLELTREIRATRDRHDLAVIGMSAVGDNKLAANFIKAGASDFIYKPFLSEELYCRVTQNIELLEHIDTIREMSNRDYLTNLFNRRYLFDAGDKLYADCQRHGLSMVIAMIDIDHFKLVNDSHGHEVGDLVLKRVAETLQGRFRESDIVARHGGEEFCVLATRMAGEQAIQIFDELRTVIALDQVLVNGSAISITVSIGVCSQRLDSLEAMIRCADVALYQAKEAGRNRVMAVVEETD